MGKKSILLILFVFVCLISCDKTDDSSDEFEIVSDEESDNIKAILDNRSFRQFLPDKDASPRKAIQISFIKHNNQTVEIIGLYNTDPILLSNLWRINAVDFTVLKNNKNIYKLNFIGISSKQEIPEECRDCLNLKPFSLYMRNPFDENQIEFKLEQNANLPNPYPVFLDWTKFNEDEHYH